MRATLFAVCVTTTCATWVTSCAPPDVTFPDAVTPGDIAGPSGGEWWLGMPPVSPGELALDARLTHFSGGTFSSFNTIDVCRGACRHIGYGGLGLVVLDNANEGIQRVDGSGAVVETLPFPLPAEEQAGPWVMAARGSTLVAAAGQRLFERDGDAWIEGPSLDLPVFSIAVQSNGVVVAQRDDGDVLLPAALIDGAWLTFDDDIIPGSLLLFETDGTFKSSQSIAPPEGVSAFVPLHMFSTGLLGARLLGGALDAIVVAEDGTVTTWASLGGAEEVNAQSFRATVFDDGQVGVLYPGPPRDEGVGPKTKLHVGAAP